MFCLFPLFLYIFSILCVMFVSANCVHYTLRLDLPLFGQGFLIFPLKRQATGACHISGGRKGDSLGQWMTDVPALGRGLADQKLFLWGVYFPALFEVPGLGPLITSHI